MELRFRSYVPKSEALRQAVIKVSGVPTKEAESALSEAKIRSKTLSGEDLPVLVGSKRANWDLKRDSEKKLKRLAKRTQVAISQLAEELQRDRQEDEEA
ncbi:hypothetical protein BASA81_000501 [Batrachochytrium salamandrivorans]|nr:hypothetical protein BASA81_000501 [Batrachochytrium salamandrivorans]